MTCVLERASWLEGHVAPAGEPGALCTLTAARWMAGLVLLAVGGAMGFVLIMTFYVAVVGRIPEATVWSIHIAERTVPALLRVVLAVLMLPLHYVMEDILFPVTVSLFRPSQEGGKR